MTTSDYINLALFVAVIAFASIDLSHYMKTRRLLTRAIGIIAELVLINNSRVTKNSQDPREFQDATSLSSRATQLLQDAR